MSGYAANELPAALVVGLGCVGALAGELMCAAGARVVGYDRAAPRRDLGFAVSIADVRDIDALTAAVDGAEVVLSCLPYDLNAAVARVAHARGVHYFDVTEDRAASQLAQELAERSPDAALVPHCGLAPGYVCMLGAHLLRLVDRPTMLRLSVGALPVNPVGRLGYAVTWSAEGLVNEYLNPCDILRDGKRCEVAALSTCVDAWVDGTPLESFPTSGGLGTMCMTYEGVVDDLQYQTLRYRGHLEAVRPYLDTTAASRSEIADTLRRVCPATDSDVVLVQAEVWGADGVREVVSQRFEPRDVVRRRRTAISWTTAAGLCGAVELLLAGELPGHGLVRQEAIPLDRFLTTVAGRMLATQASPARWIENDA